MRGVRNRLGHVLRVFRVELRRRAARAVAAERDVVSIATACATAALGVLWIERACTRARRERICDDLCNLDVKDVVVEPVSREDDDVARLHVVQ
eukprot:49064-Chlamydomonas_euryale.AAC.2